MKIASTVLSVVLASTLAFNTVAFAKTDILLIQKEAYAEINKKYEDLRADQAPLAELYRDLSKAQKSQAGYTTVIKKSENYAMWGGAGTFVFGSARIAQTYMKKTGELAFLARKTKPTNYLLIAAGVVLAVTLVSSTVSEFVVDIAKADYELAMSQINDKRADMAVKRQEIITLVAKQGIVATYSETVVDGLPQGALSVGGTPLMQMIQPR